MADLDKIYQLTIENNTNIKHLMNNHDELKEDVENNSKRLVELEGYGKKTAKEHLISFSKISAAFLVIGSGMTAVVKWMGNIWR